MSKYTKVNVAGDGACYFHAVTGFFKNKIYYIL